MVTSNHRSIYRVGLVVWQLGWVDLDLGSSPGWWAATVATYCPSRMVEHSKSKSTQPCCQTTSPTLYLTEEILRWEGYRSGIQQITGAAAASFNWFPPLIRWRRRSTPLRHSDYKTSDYVDREREWYFRHRFPIPTEVLSESQDYNWQNWGRCGVLGYSLFRIWAVNTTVASTWEQITKDGILFLNSHTRPRVCCLGRFMQLLQSSKYTGAHL